MQTGSRAIAAAGVIFGLLGATVARAQSGETAQDGEIVVTAQKRSERARDVPLTVVSQTGEQLAAAGIINTRDLAQVVPGLTFSTTGAWSQPAIRGVSSTSTNPGAESPVAIYLDGIYQPSQNGQIFDLPDISRVEVLKGPQGTLFGRNATAGAIQIFTRDPSFKTTADVTATAGFYSGRQSKSGPHYGVRGFASTPLVEDKLAVSLSGYYDRNEGFLKNLVSGNRDGGVTSIMFRGKLLFEPAPGAKFVLAALYSKRRDFATEAATVETGYSAGGSVPGAIVPLEPFTVAWDSARPYYTAETWGTSLRGDFELGIGSLTSLTGYNDLKARADVDVDGSFVSFNPATRLAACPACVAYVVDTPTEAFSQEIDLVTKRFGIASLTTGLNYFWAKSEEGGNANDNAFFYRNIVKTESYAGFAEANLFLTDQLTFIGGVRYNNETKAGLLGFFGATPVPYRKKRFTSWTPRASVRYALTPELNAFFTFSKGFKSGVLQNTDPVSPPANPEKLTSYEGGLKYGAGGNSLNLTFFHYDYSNLQALIYFGTQSITQNAASAKIDGFDVDGTVRLNSDTSLRAAVSWIPKAKFTDYRAAIAFVPVAGSSSQLQSVPFDASGTRMLRAPKLTVSGGVDYGHFTSFGRLTGNLSVYYSSAYRWEVTNRVRTNSYTTVNITVGIEPTNSPFTISLFAKNLTAAKIVQGTLLSGSGDLSFYAPPRELGLNLRVKY